jgi:hypothetical protein
MSIPSVDIFLLLSMACVLRVEQDLAADAVKQGSVKLAMFVEV